MRLCCAILLVLVGNAPALADAPEDLHRADEPDPWPVDQRVELRLDRPEPLRKWYLHLGFINAYPKMQSEDLIHDLFNPLMRAIAPGFDDVSTVGDLRDQNLLLQPQIGLGRILSPRWTWTFQTGWAAGKIRTVADDPSLLILPLHTDFEIRRSAMFLGTGVDFYPFRMPEQRPYVGLGDRLRAIRPYVGGSITATYATYRARVRIGLVPLPNLGLTLSDAWLVFNTNVHLGLEVPLTERDSFVINYGVNHFNRQGHDFEGTALSFEWKRMFRWRGRANASTTEPAAF